MSNETYRSAKKLFYGNASWYFSLAAAVTVFAFFPSYFGRLTVTDTAHHLHGITAKLWLVHLIDNFSKSLNISYLIIEITLILLLLDDKHNGKIRFPYLLALALFIVQHLMMIVVRDIPLWIELMDAFAKLHF